MQRFTRQPPHQTAASRGARTAQGDCVAAAAGMFGLPGVRVEEGVAVAPPEPDDGVGEAGPLDEGATDGVADGVAEAACLVAGVVGFVFWPPTTPPTVVPPPDRFVTIAFRFSPADSSITVITATAMRKVPTVIAVSTSQRGLFPLPSLAAAALAIAAAVPAGMACGRPSTAAKVSVGELPIGSLGLVVLEVVTAPCSGAAGRGTLRTCVSAASAPSSWRRLGTPSRFWATAGSTRPTTAGSTRPTTALRAVRYRRTSTAPRSRS